MDKDMWHLVLIGQEQRRPGNREASASLGKIIAAASYQPIKDLQTIYLSWIALSSMKAEFVTWNTKMKKKQPTNDDVKSYFDGSTLSNGKGIGSTILASVHYICPSLVPTQLPMNQHYYQKIICQSSAQALEFYKVAMGFVEITDSTTITKTVLNRFITSQQVIPIKFTGRLSARRPTKVETRQDIHHIFHQALCNMFAVKPTHVLKTVHNLLGFMQRRGASIYYSTDEEEFLSTCLKSRFINEHFTSINCCWIIQSVR
jgi:hypothetical protein